METDLTTVRRKEDDCGLDEGQACHREKRYGSTFDNNTDNQVIFFRHLLL